MTIANQSNRTSAVGSGAIGQEVPFSFPYAATSDITVYERVTATGVETLLAEPTNYTLTAASDIGGTLTTVTAVAATSEIHIIRNTPKTQSLDLEAGGSFNAEDVEDAFDKSIKLIIENRDSLDRALRAPATDAVALDLELPSSVDRASKNLGFDASGNVTVTESDGTFATTNAYWDDVKVKSPWADVRAYGAKGDGTTDDATAINKAIGTGNRVVFFPYTSTGYKISSPILMKSRTILEGASRGTYIYPDAETFAAITVTGTVTYWSIRDLSISYGEATGDVAATDTAAAGIQLLLDGANYPHLFDISRVNILYPYRGFEALNVASFMYSLSNVFVYKAGNYGYWIDPTVSATTITLQNCYTNYNKGGFRIEKVKDLSLLSCACDHTSENYPFYFESCRGGATGIHIEAGTINSASINIAGGQMQLVSPFFSSNTLTDGAYEINCNSNAQVEIVGGENFNSVCSGAGTYAVCFASATAKQLIARGCSFIVPTGDGTKTIYLGDVRRYNANTTIEPTLARTSTVGGATTGLIPDGTQWVIITSDNADKQITLPTAIPGSTVGLVTPATGCELICTGATVKINDITCGATNELALAADSHFICECISSSEWIVRGFTKLGADIAALVPDAL